MKKTILYLGLFIAPLSIVSAQGFDLDDPTLMQIPAKMATTRSINAPIARSVSLKMYAPPVMQQVGQTCIAASLAYAARTIIEAKSKNETDKNAIAEMAFSPEFTHHFGAKKSSSSCMEKVSLAATVAQMKEVGMLQKKEYPKKCEDTPTAEEMRKAKYGALKEVLCIADLNTPKAQISSNVRKSLSAQNPVLIAMALPKSFTVAKNVWQPKSGEYIALPHAMCIVGYDDNKQAFEVMNSWGETFGNQGYVWIPYEAMNEYAKYAYEVIADPMPAVIPTVKPTTEVVIPKIKLGGEMRFETEEGVEVKFKRGQEIKNGLKTSSESRGFGVTAAADYKAVAPIYSGDRFKAVISVPQNTYIYIISSDNTQKVQVLFPHRDDISPLITAKEEIRIPFDNDYITADDIAGRDFMCVIFSQKPLNIDKITQDIENCPEKGFVTKLTKVLDKKIGQALGDSFGFGETDIKFEVKEVSLSLFTCEFDHRSR